MDAFDQLDQKQVAPQTVPGQPQAPVQPQAAAQPQAGGDAFDQLPADKSESVNISSQATNQKTATPYNWLERMEGSVLQHVPFAEDNKVLNWVNTHVAQPPVKMGEEVGKIFSQHGLEMLGEGLHAGEQVPEYAKSDPGAYWKLQLEKEKPELAGVASSVFDTIGNIGGNPTNWPLMGASAAKSALARTFAKVFGVQMATDAIREGGDLWDNWEKMDTEQKYKRVTDLITHAYFTKKSMEHGTAPSKEGPQPKPAAERVAGERQTTKNIAGVETPVSAQHAQTIETNNPVEATGGQAQALNEFKRTQTAPAATAAMHSVLGQGAEDLIAQHDAVTNATELPEKVAGTNQPSKYESIDDAAQALNQKARSTTYAKADEISEREQQAHQQNLQSALQNEKEGIDHYNQLVDEHNAQLGEGEEPMQHETFDPTRIQEEFEKQRPKTYGELKGALDRANNDLQSRDASVREEAVDAKDKATKALDGWFKQHSDEISPEEYTSAKKLVYAGARYQEIANGLRASIDNDNLTGNKLRSIIANVDNKMIRRGEAPGAFQRLVGDDVYKNWREVARLFDPILTKDPGTMTYGKLALGYVVHHFFGPLGLVGRVGAHWLMDKALSSPEWGNWFKDMSDAVREKAASGRDIPMNLLQKFKTMYENSKIGGEEGAAGAKVSPRNVGEPAPPKFGRAGLGGKDAFDQLPDEEAERLKQLVPTNDNDWLAKAKESKPGASLSEQLQEAARLKNANPEDEQLRAHNSEGGSIFVGNQNMAGENKYSVGAYPERTQQVTEPLTAEHLHQFKQTNADLLNQEGHGIGTWKDPDTGNSVLDVARLYGDRNEAVNAGRQANQKAIYHLGGEGEISTGGTGEPLGRPTPSRKWPTGDNLIKKYGEANDPAHAAFLLDDGRAVAQTGTEHDRMLGGTPKDDLRTPFVNETGAIRMRSYGVYGDRQFNLSLPESGITAEQLKKIEKWGPQMRTGKIYLEVAKPNGAHVVLDQGSNPDLAQEIKKLVPVGSDAQATPTEPRTPVYANRGDGVHEVTTKDDAGDPKGYLLARDVEGNPDAVRIKSHRAWEEGKGIGSSQIETLAQSLAGQGKTTLLSDTEMTDSARRPWEKLMTQYPDAVTRTEHGYIFDLTKLTPETPASSEIATRRPTSTRVSKSNAPGQYADMAGVEQASAANPGGNGKLGYAEKLSRTIQQYSGLTFTPDELKNPKAVMEKAIDRMTDNLVALHDAMPEPMRETARHWYDTANVMAKDMAEKHGVTKEQSAGVLAALSPQNAWDNNVALANRLLDTYKNRQTFEFSPKMEAAVAKIKGGQLSKAGLGILKDISGKTLADIAQQPMPERLRKKWGEDAPQKWENVKAAQQGMWVRLYDEAHNSPENPMFHPNGDVVGISPSNRSWIGLDHIAKAIRIINDGSVENINDVMGEGNKIRNFYNNIINPNSENGHVTVDTHAVGAAHFQPFSGDDAEVMHNFGNSPKGIPGAPKHAATGMRGTYPLYAEAYRRAAERLGVQPRELQSMTWEGIRSLMGDEKKTPELKAFAREQWDKVQNKELTTKQARENIIEKAGGFSKPAWMTEAQWDEAQGTGFNPEEFK